MNDDLALHLVAVRPERFKAAFNPSAVGLQEFNVVIGRNGSGKSTLLESLQWLDTAIRRDAREACDRYFGVGDLVNLRSQSKPPYFKIELEWAGYDEDAVILDLDGHVSASYSVKVVDDEGIPRIDTESLTVTSSGTERPVIVTVDGVRMIGTGASSVRVVDSDRLALALVNDTQLNDPVVRAIASFWSRAVFLRLSPNRLSEGSPAIRRSFEPILDEEGQNLPALLFELSSEQREELASDLQEMLPNIRSVEVTETGERKDKRASYSLLERMPYRGRAGRFQIPVPAWMLSEGTRRITALLALLRRTPAPSLLCIEEIENGLDPWTIGRMIRQLQGVALDSTQVIISTHSPWLLDHVPRDSILVVRRVEGDTQYLRFDESDQVNAFNPNLTPGVIYSNLEFPNDDAS